jgi:hypothetical protein
LKAGIRRVAIDDDAEGYVSPGPELGDEPPYRGHEDDVHDEYDYEAEVPEEDDPNAEGVAYAYGTGTEEGTDADADK